MSGRPDPAGAWEPGEKKQGTGYTYQVFSQQQEGEEFVRYQVRGTIDAPADVIQRTASRVSPDPARAPKDQKRTGCTRTRTRRCSCTEIDLPALFTDRDVVTRGKSSVDPATGVRRIDFKSAEHGRPRPRTA